jgi:hypothetical protein
MVLFETNASKPIVIMFVITLRASTRTSRVDVAFTWAITAAAVTGVENGTPAGMCFGMTSRRPIGMRHGWKLKRRGTFTWEGK